VCVCVSVTYLFAQFLGEIRHTEALIENKREKYENIFIKAFDWVIHILRLDLRIVSCPCGSCFCFQEECGVHYVHY